MSDPQPFLVEIWQGVRSKLLAAAIDTGQYLTIWALVAVAHLVKLVMAYLGVDQMLVAVVTFLEKWVFIASFASYFWRILMRLWVETKRSV